MLARLHERMSGGRFGEGKGSENLRLDFALGDQRPDIVFECPADRGLFLDRARAERRARKGQALHHHGQEIDFDLGALEEGDGNDAPVLRGAADVLPDIAAAHHIEDHVGAAAVRCAQDLVCEIGLPIIYGALGAKALACPALLVAAGSGEDIGAEGARQHDGSGADAGRAAMDEKGFAAPEAGAIEDIRPHGHEGFRHGSRFDEAQALWQRHGVRLGDHAIFGIAAAWNEGQDFIADLESLRLIPLGDNGAGDLETRRRRRAWRGRIASLALENIRTVHTCGGNLDEQLMIGRDRRWQGRKSQDLGSAGCGNLDRLHALRQGYRHGRCYPLVWKSGDGDSGTTGAEGGANRWTWKRTNRKSGWKS